MMKRVQTGDMIPDLFQQAATDYLQLLEKGYPQKTILKLVGDRYKLSGTERNMLFRGISTQKSSADRRKKQGSVSGLPAQKLLVDTANQLLTIASYLNGNAVFISTDGFLRDASGIHGKALQIPLLQRSIDLVLSYFRLHRTKHHVFFVDVQMQKMKAIMPVIHEMAMQHGLSFEVIISGSVDQLLESAGEGLVCTSDSEIIEKTSQPVFDLARHTLTHFFSPEFSDLREILK
jgi:hypothetical protein